MDSNTKKSLADYMKEVEPYEKEETWVDDCRTLKDVARALVTLQKEIKEGNLIKHYAEARCFSCAFFEV